jgi:hypothetical protein
MGKRWENSGRGAPKKNAGKKGEKKGKDRPKEANDVLPDTYMTLTDDQMQSFLANASFDGTENRVTLAVRLHSGYECGTRWD